MRPKVAKENLSDLVTFDDTAPQLPQGRGIGFDRCKGKGDVASRLQGKRLVSCFMAEGGVSVVRSDGPAL